ncbi:MAG: hypothetical protein ACLQDV_20505 [Candidatus Binataceae bacterium]
METARITRFFGKLGAALRAHWLRGSIDKALALNRYQVRPDGLWMEGKSLSLTISWRARDVHPWDSDLAPDRKAIQLVEQTLSDTLAALERLFMTLPEVDLIDLRVHETDARKHGTLLSGLISRREFETCQMISPTMKLRLLGVSYNLVNSHLEPLSPSCLEHEIPSSELDVPERSGSFDSSGFGKGPSQRWH